MRKLKRTQKKHNFQSRKKKYIYMQLKKLSRSEK